MVLKLYLSGCQNYAQALKFLLTGFGRLFLALGHLPVCITLSGCLNNDNLIGENCYDEI